MARSEISSADAWLLAELERLGVRCSRHQLERWRHYGLLPRAVIHHPGGGGSRASLPVGSTELAALLAAHARRGVAWQHLALIELEHGYRLSERTLREALSWLLQREDRSLHRFVNKVRAALEAARETAPDELDLAEAIAALVRGSRAERRYFAVNGPIIAERYPNLSRRERYDLLRTGIVWNVAERLGESIVGEPVALAQGWLSETDAAAGGFTEEADPARVSFSDRQAVVATISPDEYTAVLQATRATLQHYDLELGVGEISAMVVRSLAQIRIAWLGGVSVPLGPKQFAAVIGESDDSQSAR